MADLESPPLGGFCGGYGLGWVSKFEVRARPLGLQTGTGPTRDGLRTKKCSEPGPAGSDGRYIFSQPPSKSGLLAMKCCRGGGAGGSSLTRLFELTTRKKQKCKNEFHIVRFLELDRAFSRNDRAFSGNGRVFSGNDCVTTVYLPESYRPLHV